MLMPRSLNNALQVKLKEWGISFHDVPALPSLIKDYLAGYLSKELFKARLAQAFRRKITKIPRKGAMAGYEIVPSPEDQMSWLIESVLTIVESAKSIPRSKLA